MQAISLIMECYTKKAEFYDAKPIVDRVKQFVDQAIAAEAGTKQREKRIQDYIAKAQLTQKDIDIATNSQAGSCYYS